MRLRASTGVLVLGLGPLMACSEGRPQVVISEIMYHPVDEQSPQEDHEFVEIHNRGTGEAALAGWQLSGGVRYTFPARTTLPAGGYLVVAKNRLRLLQVTAYQLDPRAVIGQYEGELDNDGEQIALLDDGGGVVDQVAYDDRFPWPVGADALGAGEAWLAPEKLGSQSLAEHRFLGRSLERVSYLDGKADLAGAWDASPLDGATPGRPPASTLVRPAVTALGTIPTSTGSDLITATDAVRVRVRFSRAASPQAPEVELYADDFEKVGEPTTTVPLALLGADEGYEAVLPTLPERSVVRYRVVDRRPEGPLVISPRPSDPYDWHAYFVSPKIESKTPVFQVFIGKADWERMWDHIEQGRVPGHVGTLGGKPGFCDPNPFWNARVPATLVVGGEVFDVQVRYQGSGVNRTGASRSIDRRAWPMEVDMPSRPSPFRALSWRIAFPRHHRFGKQSALNLNKLTDAACLGFSYAVGVRLFEQAGIPAGQQPHYVRLYVNGAYYNYMQRMEVVDEQLIRRFYGKDHVMGDLFKSTGIRWEQGPFGWGDERILEDNCGYTAAQRYDTTYSRQSLTDWKRGSAEVKKLIEDLHAARAGGVPAMRAFFETHFDLPVLTTYMAIRNWLAPWDDYFHNHYLYRRADGRWILIPNDFDGEMGINPLSWHDTSFFNGQENDRSNRNNWVNYLKDAYLKSFRPELIARLKELSATVLHPSNVEAAIDAAAAGYDVAEAKMAPNAAPFPMFPLCSIGDAPMVADRMKSFARRRYERILDGLFD
jgi:hypothetical protein